MATISHSPKRAVISASSLGDNTITSAVTAKRHVIIGGVLIASAPVGVTFKSSGGTALTGELPLAANGGFQIPFADSEVGNFETLTGEGLLITLDDAIAVGGWLTYIEV